MPKKKLLKRLQGLNYKVIAIGDSYNDIAMLRKADHGILFNPPRNVIDENKDLKLVTSYDDLRTIISHLIETEK